MLSMSSLNDETSVCLASWMREEAYCTCIWSHDWASALGGRRIVVNLGKYRGSFQPSTTLETGLQLKRFDFIKILYNSTFKGASPAVKPFSISSLYNIGFVYFLVYCAKTEMQNMILARPRRMMSRLIFNEHARTLAPSTWSST